MSIKNRIELLDKIGQKLSAMPETQAIISEAAKQNTWFTPEFSQSSISAICTEFLQAEKLSAWLKPYFIEDNFKLNKTVGIIAAEMCHWLAFTIFCVVIFWAFLHSLN
ncbi:MAG: hypothetical protein M9931_06985 [Chitinophagales bacterium]|nr:hypothetical protein [Chitinophagales bacterium]